MSKIDLMKTPITDEILIISREAEDLNDSQFDVYLRRSDLKIYISEYMCRYGGSFVKALSQCIVSADDQNLLKLVAAFRNYFNQYLPHKWDR